VDYGASEFEAKAQVLTTCKNDDQGDGCQTPLMKCDEMKESSPKIVCSVTNRMTGKMFLGRGRSTVEAQGFASRQCGLANVENNYAIHCAPPECQGH
jgi:hypothetical protein